MNDLLKEHFTEEEFIELRDGKTITKEYNYVDGGPFIKNTIEKTLGVRQVKSNHFTRYTKEYPGGQLIKLEDNYREIKNTIKLSHKNYHSEYDGPDKPFKITEHLWILTLKIETDTGTSGKVPFETDYLTGWTRVSDGWNESVYYGVGDTYGELKPLSQSIDNSKFVDNIQVGDVFIHLMKSHCLYIKEIHPAGVFYKNKATIVCETWGFNAFRQGNNEIIPTPDILSHPIHYIQDINMEELDILNMYTFLMKSKQGSTNLEDYFEYYGKK